jgi:hypothetical protein
MVVAYRLNAEVHAIQRENQRIEDANNAYQQQLQAISRPDGAEEQARLHNYVAPGERVFVVANPALGASPAPRPSASPTYSSEVQGAQTSGGFWQDIWGALNAAMHP